MISINARHLLTKYHKRVSNDVLIPFCVVYGTRRFMHKIGDKVPINYVKGIVNNNIINRIINSSKFIRW